MELSLKNVGLVLFGICAVWVVIRHIVRRIRVRRDQTAEYSCEIRALKTPWRLRDTIHWQKKEIRDYEEMYRYSVKQIEPDKIDPEVERDYSILMSSLRDSNSNLNKALTFSFVASFFVLLFQESEPERWALACASVLLIGPYFLVNMIGLSPYSALGHKYSSEGRYDYSFLFFREIDRKAVGRELFATGVWAVAISLGFAILWFGIGKGSGY